jgi:hypothetical protein
MGRSFRDLVLGLGSLFLARCTVGPCDRLGLPPFAFGSPALRSARTQTRCLERAAFQVLI